MGECSLDFTVLSRSSGMRLWRKESQTTPRVENGHVPGLLNRPHHQLRSKPLMIPCPPTPWTWTKVVAGGCPTSVPGQGHQWLLPTHVPRVASAQRPVRFRNQNKGNAVQHYLLKKCLFLQSSYFCQICVRPLTPQVSQGSILFILSFCIVPYSLLAFF